VISTLEAMSAREVPDRFRVAFSLAGEQRHVVLPIAQEVEAVLGASTVFYDDWYEHYIAGPDADLRLQEICGRRADLVIVCVSGAYGDKPWTQAEHRAVRDRFMQARTEAERLAILPLRVGDGDVEGILLNEIVPDVRARTAVAAAELILARLALTRRQPGDVAGAEPTNWPAEWTAPDWPMADHTDVRSAFVDLLSEGSATRALLLRGPSEAGKTHMSNQMAGTVLSLPGVFGGRFDFKGTSGIGVEAFCDGLELGQPERGTLEGTLSRVLAGLRQRAQPSVLVFDTYEAAAAEAQDWIQKVLLPAVMSASWLRVVVLGQSVPNRVGSMWETRAAVMDLGVPAAEDWHAYARTNRRDTIELDFVRQAYELAGGRARVLGSLLGPVS
jgi:hypothetical protein